MNKFEIGKMYKYKGAYYLCLGLHMNYTWKYELKCVLVEDETVYSSYIYMEYSEKFQLISELEKKRLMVGLIQ